MWFRTPQCSGHTKDFGGVFLAVTWQCKVFSWHSWRFLWEDLWICLGSSSTPFQNIPDGSHGLETLTHHYKSATKAHRDREENQLCLPLCPGGGFCSAECLANLTSVWKAANNLTKVFSAFFFMFSSCCIKLGKRWFSNNSKSKFRFWNTVPFILKYSKWWLLRIWLIFKKIGISQWGEHSIELLR